MDKTQEKFLWMCLKRLEHQVEENRLQIAEIRAGMEPRPEDEEERKEIIQRLIMQEEQIKNRKELEQRAGREIEKLEAFNRAPMTVQEVMDTKERITKEIKERQERYNKNMAGKCYGDDE